MRIEIEELSEVVERFVESQPRTHFLDLNTDAMSVGLLQKVACELHELVEVPAGAQLRIDVGIDRVDADAQTLERRSQQSRAHLFRQQQPIRTHARFGKKPNGVVDARVE